MHFCTYTTDNCKASDLIPLEDLSSLLSISGAQSIVLLNIFHRKAFIQFALLSSYRQQLLLFKELFSCYFSAYLEIDLMKKEEKAICLIFL